MRAARSATGRRSGTERSGRLTRRTPLRIGLAFNRKPDENPAAEPALDAATGELLWVHSEDEGARAAASPRQLSGRGLAYWSDGKEERILYVTTGYRLVALDARTGNAIPGFLFQPAFLFNQPGIK